MPAADQNGSAPIANTFHFKSSNSRYTELQKNFEPGSNRKSRGVGVALEEELDFSRDRNASLKLISWFDIAKVRNARILVVGAGAIGNEVLKNLALMGVGQIYIIDLDTIEISNLSRSVLYRARDDGLKKAHAAARAVSELNPDCEVYWHHGDLETDLGEGFLRRFDVVLSCLDSVYARYILNRRCLRAGVPWVDSGIATMDGQVQVFHAGAGVCYECGFGDAHYELALGRIVNSCNAIAAEAKKVGRSPTTVMIASIVAGVQVQECLKLLDRPAWGNRTFIGRKFEFSGSSASVDAYVTPVREGCPAHDFELDWDSAEPIPIADASAAMPLTRFLAVASEALKQDVHLALDSEFTTGYVCPQCGSSSRQLLAIHKALGERLRCACGWIPSFQSDLTLLNRVSPDMAHDQFAEVPLNAFDIPLGGVVELHAANRVVRHVLLAGDMSNWESYWQHEKAKQ